MSSALSATERPAVRGSGAWYRQPILWLGALIFAASVAGCVLMIVLGARYADESVPVDSTTLLKMPLERPVAPVDPPRTPQ